MHSFKNHIFISIAFIEYAVTENPENDTDNDEDIGDSHVGPNISNDEEKDEIDIGWQTDTSVTLHEHLQEFDRYHGGVSRIHAEELLHTSREKTYLVRESESRPGELSLSLFCEKDNKVYHYRIGKDYRGNCFLRGGSSLKSFKSLHRLIAHYSNAPIAYSNNILLRHPLSKKTENESSLNHYVNVNHVKR